MGCAQSRKSSKKQTKKRRKNASLQDEIEKCRAANETEHNNLLQEKNDLMAALKNKEEQLESHHLYLNKYRTLALSQTNTLKKAHMKYEQQENCHFEELEQLIHTNEARLNNIKGENKKLKATLTNVEEQLNTCCLENNQLIAAQKQAEQQWQEERCSLQANLDNAKRLYAANLEQQKKEEQKLVAGLETFKEMAQNECLQLKQEKASLLDEIEKCRATNETEHNNLLQEKNDLMAALKNKEEQLESHHLYLNKYKALSMSQTNTLKKARMKYEQQEKCHFEELEQLIHTNEARLNNIKGENKKLKATLANVEEQLNTCCLENNQLIAAQKQAEQQWQKERCALQANLDNTQRLYAANLEQQKKEEQKLVAGLETFNEMVQNKCLQWKQEKASLLDEIEKCRAASETERSNLLQEKNDLMAALKNKEEQLESHHLYLNKYKALSMSQTNTLKKARMKYEQQEKCHLEELEQLMHTNEAKLNNIKGENKKLKATLTNVEEQLNTCCLENNQLIATQKQAEQQWQEERCSLQANLNNTQSFYAAKHKQQMKKEQQLVAGLETFKKKAQNECLQWKQEKASLLDEIEKCRAASETERSNLLQEKNDLMEALKNKEEQLESRHVQWKEEITFFMTQLDTYKELCMSQRDTLKKVRMKYEQEKAEYLQTIQDLKSTLQRTEQD